MISGVLLGLLGLGTAWAGDFALPDPHLTPGVVVPGMTKERVCATKWGLDHRHVTDKMKREVCRRYGLECPIRAQTFIPFLSHPGAGATMTRAVYGIYPGVAGIERMTAWTMRPPGFVGKRSAPTSNIDSLGHGLQMVGIHARRGPTLMVEYQRVGNFLPQELVDEDVRAELTEAAVAATHHAIAYPQPTTTRRLALDSAFIRDRQAKNTDASISKSGPGPVAQTHCSGDSSICADGIEIDHLIPRELGGADAVENLWPQPIAEARVKDRVENFLHRAVCAGTFSLGIAQATMRTDWRTVLPQATRPR